jgi:hypothetical protein
VIKKEILKFEYLLIGMTIFFVLIGSYFFINKGIENSTAVTNIIEIGPGELSRESFEEFSAIFNDEEEIQERNGEKFIVDPDKIRSGGPPKDGIPSIDNPKYVSMEDADGWISDNELVLALEYKGVERVYPLQIMVWHEIVNDIIAGDPILITYCPLCGSGIAYYRVLEGGEVVEFGTSGKLFNSNLVMYDRKTESYWTQIDGEAIIGELTGFELQELSVDTVVWRDWKKEHPNSKVLSQNTGFNRNYGRDPYGSYYEDSFLIFPVEQEDNRIHAKTVIFGIEVNGKYKAYMEDDLEEEGIIEDNVGGKDITLERLDDGRVIIIDENGKEIVKERDFWFAWYAFHPDTGLYGFE